MMKEVTAGTGLLGFCLACKEKLIMIMKMEARHSEGPWQTEEMAQRNFMKFSKSGHEVLHQGRKLSEVGT